MKQTRRLTALIERVGDGFVALCPEVDVASQGATIAEAYAGLKEALTRYYESGERVEFTPRLRGDFWVTSVEVAVG